MANYLERTFGSGGNLKKWTVSFWMKPSVTQTNNQHIFSVTGDSGNDQGLAPRYRLGSSGTIEFAQADNGWISDLESRAQLRDPSAWYHIVLVWDSNNATSGDRCIMYINGVRQTSFGTESYPTQNIDSMTNKSGWKHGIGSNVHNDGWSGTRNPFSGQLSQFYFCDGYAYAASDFGQTDSTSGEWKPKSFAGSFGTTGFYLKFETTASNGLGTDSSGNGNHWTVVNGDVRQQSIDTPTNNFPVLNSIGTIGRTNQQQTDLNNGSNNDYCNTTTRTRTSGQGESAGACTSTFGLPQRGKWYWEWKIIGGATGGAWFGIESTYATSTYNVIYYGNNGNKYVDGSGSSYGASYGSGDVIGAAVDVDNNQVTFYKNNSSQGTITASSLQDHISSHGMFAFFSDGGGDGPEVAVNFGNPSPDFGLASAQADANGYGNFEYAPPTGFYALCTQNISQYGGA